MILDFSQLQENENPGFKGGDGSFFVRAFSDGAVRIMEGRLEPGSSIGMHTHTGNCEVLYLLEGCGTLAYPNGQTETLLPGEVHYCPEGCGHSLQNRGSVTLRFVAVVPTQNPPRSDG